MWALAAVALLTLIAAALRIPLLSRPMGSDEAASFLYYASHPLPVALTIYGSPNNHILHSVLMHVSYAIFGRAEWALRLPAFLAGVAIVPLTYVASRKLARDGALIAAALSVSAPVLIDYSTDARGYTMLCCFTLLCAIAMADITRTGKRGAIALFAISAALGFWTVPVMLYPFVMLAVWGLITPMRKQAAIAAAAAILLTIVVYIPPIVVSGMAMLTSNPYVRPLPHFLDSALPYTQTAWLQLFVAVPVIVQIVIAFGIIAAIARRAVPPMWIGLFAVMILLVIQRVLPFPRVWLPFLPLLFITAAAAWNWGSKIDATVAAAALIALGLAGLVTPRLRETGELPAVDRIVRVLNVAARPGDPVLALPPSEMPLAFYCPRVEVLRPDLTRPRLFVVENRAYGQTLQKTLAFFRLDSRGYSIRRMDFGSSALDELRR